MAQQIIYVAVNITATDFANGTTYYINDGGVYKEATSFVSGTQYYIKTLLVDQIYLEDEHGNYSLLSFASNTVASPQWKDE